MDISDLDDQKAQRYKHIEARGPKIREEHPAKNEDKLVRVP